MIRIGVLLLLGSAILLAGVGCGRGSSSARTDMPIKSNTDSAKPGKKTKAVEAALEDPNPPKR